MNEADIDLLERMTNMDARLRALQAELERVVIDNHFLREACARIVEPNEEHRRDSTWGYVEGEDGIEMLDGIAAAIRARGEKLKSVLMKYKSLRELLTRLQTN